MAVASNRQAAQVAAPRRASVAAPGAEVPEFSKEQELTAFRDMLRSAASRKRPASSTAWA